MDVQIYEGEYGYTCVGRVDNDGVIYRGEYGYDCIGHVDNSGRLLHFRAGGAALLLGLL